MGEGKGPEIKGKQIDKDCLQVTHQATGRERKPAYKN